MADTDARLSAYRLLSRYRPAETTLSRLFLEHGADDALSAGEASFARELVRGTVRRLNTLDWLIGVFSSRSGKIDPSVRNILRLGLFQILYFSDRVPEYAAVHESVELARKTGKAHAAGFVNALLRTAARKRSTLPWPDPEKEPSRAVALRHAHPEWMVERWMKRLGNEETVRLCESDNGIPPLTVRVNTLKASREELRTALEKEGVQCDLCRYSPDGLILLSRPEIEKLAVFKDGWFVVQDEASQLVTRVLDPQPGERVFDLCSGTTSRRLTLLNIPH
jgi:16S rRNA (cytosine967-C5)-methyltransferase